MDLGYKIKKGIYLISPEKIENLKQFTTDLKFILKNVPISFFQLRLKNIDEAGVIEIMQAIKPICIKFNTEIILNDNYDIASKYALDGVHLGKSDGNVGEIKRKFTGVIGVSCYNDVNRALEMSKLNVQYVSFGAFYPSSTKKDTVPCDISVLKSFKKQTKTPVCVIGGLNSSNTKPLVQAGADLVALSSAVWNLAKNTERVEELKKILSFFNL